MSDLTEKDQDLLRDVEERIFARINPGFDLAELNILDDVNASRKSIQDLGVQISVSNPEIASTVMEIARSIYFGHSLQGEVRDFFDEVIRLGADRVKLLVFSLSLFSLSKTPEARQRAAKSAAISVLGRMIAEQMDLKADLVRKIEAGGLLSQLGRNLLMKARELGMPLTDDFIERHESDMACRIIDHLKLDPFLKKTFDLSSLEFNEDAFSLVGIIKLAEAAVEDSFRKYGKLVLRSPLPDKDGLVIKTPGNDILKLFTALDVEDFLKILEEPTERQLAAIKRKTQQTGKPAAG